MDLPFRSGAEGVLLVPQHFGFEQVLGNRDTDEGQFSGSRSISMR
jgi:hypothetical protein